MERNERVRNEGEHVRDADVDLIDDNVPGDRDRRHLLRRLLHWHLVLGLLRLNDKLLVVLRHLMILHRLIDVVAGVVVDWVAVVLRVVAEGEEAVVRGHDIRPQLHSLVMLLMILFIKSFSWQIGSG